MTRRHRGGDGHERSGGHDCERGQRGTLTRSATCSSRRRTACPPGATPIRTASGSSKALAARPDLVPTLVALLDEARRAREPAAEAGASTPRTRALRGARGDRLRRVLHEPEGPQAHRLPGQGKRPPFPDEAEYDLRDGLLDPVIERGPDPQGAAAVHGAERRRPSRCPSACRGDGEPADVLVIGAGAGGSVAARYLAEAGFSVVCLEQGDWPNASDFPGDKLEFELVADAQWSPDPNVRQPARPTTRSRSRLADHARDVQRGRRVDDPLLRPVGAHAPAGLPHAHASTAWATTGRSPTTR